MWSLRWSMLLVVMLMSLDAWALPEQKVMLWFRGGQFEELDRHLNAVQRAYEADRNKEEELLQSFSGFGSELRQSPDAEAALDLWVSRFPSSYAARLARGKYYVVKGLVARGTKFSRQTSESAFEEMGHWFDLARRDLVSSLEASSTPLLSHIWLMECALRAGGHGEMSRYFRSAVAYAPKSLELRRVYMTSLEPRWGGSLEKMETFARESEAVFGPGLATNTLWGLFWYERVDPMLDRGDYAAVDSLLSQVLVKYGSRRLRCARAHALMQMDRADDALTELKLTVPEMTPHPYCNGIAAWIATRVGNHPGVVEMLDGYIAVNPNHVELRRARGWILGLRGNLAKAYEDLSFAAERGDSWSQRMVAKHVAHGMNGIPVDKESALVLLRSASREGDMGAQMELANLLQAMGRFDEARRERRIYQVSERVHEQYVPVDERGRPVRSWFVLFLDPRVQAVALGVLIVGLIVARSRAPRRR